MSTKIKQHVSFENWGSDRHTWRKEVSEFLSNLGKILCKTFAIWLLSVCDFCKYWRK